MLTHKFHILVFHKKYQKKDIKKELKEKFG